VLEKEETTTPYKLPGFRPYKMELLLLEPQPLKFSGLAPDGSNGSLPHVDEL